MGILSTEALAAHNVVLNVCAITFMIPYALSQAATVRVGYAVGAGEPEAARRAGYVAVWLGMGWMMIAATTMLSAPNPADLDLSRSVGAGEPHRRRS